jgi:hypothetical protein
MYTCHLSVIRRSLALDVGGFRAGYEGSQDYDLILRVTERARVVRHLPILGYHWRMGPDSTAANPSAKPYAHVAGLRAVQDHCERIGLDATVQMLGIPGYHRVVRAVVGQPRVTAVLASAGATGRTWGALRTYVTAALESVAKGSGYPVSEVLLAAPQPLAPDVVGDLKALPFPTRVVVVPGAPRSTLLNHAAARSEAEYLLLLHEDVEVVTDGFLTTMLALAQSDDVGMVGCRLLAADGTIDHAGHVYNGRPLSAYRGRGAEEIGWNGLLIVDREVSGVSSACVLVAAERFREVGGFSPLFRGDEADVDLSLKMRRLGRRIVYTPHATLHHFGATDEAVDHDVSVALEERWHHELRHDPYHHPKLVRGRDDWAIPFGPEA